MYRLFKIKDNNGTIVKVKVYPNENNRISVEGGLLIGDVIVSLDAIRLFEKVIIAVSAFMDTNSLVELNIKEETD